MLTGCWMDEPPLRSKSNFPSPGGGRTRPRRFVTAAVTRRLSSSLPRTPTSSMLKWAWCLEFRRGQCLETVFNIELVGVRGSDDDNRRVTAAVIKCCSRGRLRHRRCCRRERHCCHRRGGRRRRRCRRRRSIDRSFLRSITWSVDGPIDQYG